MKIFPKKIFLLLVLLITGFSGLGQNTNPSQKTNPEKPKKGMEVSSEPDYDQIAKDAEVELQNSMDDLYRLRDKYDPNKAPAGEPVPQEIIDMLDSYEHLVEVTKQIENLRDQQVDNTGQNKPVNDAAEPDWDQIAKNAEDAAKECEADLQKLRDKYDPNIKPEEEPVPQDIIDMLDSYGRLVRVTDELTKLRDQNENNAKTANPIQQKPTDSEKKNPSADQLVIKPTGTGQTTGHIANLNVKNNGNAPITIMPQTVYIPSNGHYQPYVATIPETTIPPKTELIVPASGYCADVHTPPVPPREAMPPIDNWIALEPTTPPASTNAPVAIVEHTVPLFSPFDIPHTIGSSGFTPIPEMPSSPNYPTWPGTGTPLVGIIDPVHHPETFAPIIIDALQNISTAYDLLRESGKITTPFSGNPDKEREAVIQQTFWIYTAAISGKKYERKTFGDNVIKQFEANTGTPLATLPEKEKEDMNSGIAEFWNTFTAVGTEAKVLSKDGMSDALNDPELIADKAPLVTIVDQISQADQFKKELKKCFFNKLEYNVSILHAYDRGTGNKKKHSRDEYAGNEKNEAELPLKKGDSLEVNLENLKCECLCWTAQEKGGKKTGTFCDCEITGVSLRSYNGQAFTDLMEADFDKYVTATLKKEVADKLDALKKANGKKSEIDKLQKQLDDEKRLIRENAARLAELKKQLNGPWRLAHDKTQSAFQVKAGFTGQVEFVFDVQGKCKGDDTCAGCEFSREVKFKVNVPK